MDAILFAILNVVLGMFARLTGIPQPWLVVDVETGGLDPLTNSLLEIAALHIPTGKVFHRYLLPSSATVSNAGAIAINGLNSDALVALGAIDEKLALTEFAEWLASLGSYLWVGANPKFDWEFVHAAMKRNAVAYKLDYHTCDIQSIAVYQHAMGKVTLPVHATQGVPSPKVDNLVAAYGVGQLRENGVHGGLVDVLMEAAILATQLSL